MKRLILAAAAAAVIVAAPGALAHPPSSPFDNTIFAPIGPGGMPVRLEKVATGLTAPNKASAVPGQPNRLYVVDQPGKLWAVDLTTGSKTVFLDVSARLVSLGFLGPGTFDERGFLGLAVQTEQGLVVPVVRGCDTASLEALAAEVARLAEAARAGSLKPEELRGSTFTVTSAGKLGGLLVTRIGPRPVARDGDVAVRQMGNVSVTFDHRVVDGARAAAFCLDVIGRLQRG